MTNGIVAVGAVAAALVAIGAAMKMYVVPLVRRTNHFLDDWFGEPERPGHKGRPGVPARLQAIEEAQRTSDERFERIEMAQAADSRAIDVLAQAVGVVVDREQQARIEGHKAAGQMWDAVAQIAENRDAQGSSG